MGAERWTVAAAPQSRWRFFSIRNLHPSAAAGSIWEMAKG